MVNNQSIQILRGNTANIKEATNAGIELLPGQLLYNTDTNMLSVGSEEDKSPSKDSIISSGVKTKSSLTIENFTIQRKINDDFTNGHSRITFNNDNMNIQTSFSKGEDNTPMYRETSNILSLEDDLGIRNIHVEESSTGTPKVAQLFLTNGDLNLMGCNVNIQASRVDIPVGSNGEISVSGGNIQFMGNGDINTKGNIMLGGNATISHTDSNLTFAHKSIDSNPSSISLEDGKVSLNGNIFFNNDSYFDSNMLSILGNISASNINSDNNLTVSNAEIKEDLTVLGEINNKKLPLTLGNAGEILQSQGDQANPIWVEPAKKKIYTWVNPNSAFNAYVKYGDYINFDAEIGTSDILIINTNMGTWSITTNNVSLYISPQSTNYSIFNNTSKIDINIRKSVISFNKSNTDPKRLDIYNISSYNIGKTEYLLSGNIVAGNSYYYRLNNNISSDVKLTSAILIKTS